MAWFVCKNWLHTRNCKANCLINNLYYPESIYSFGVINPFKWTLNDTENGLNQTILNVHAHYTMDRHLTWQTMGARNISIVITNVSQIDLSMYQSDQVVQNMQT